MKYIVAFSLIGIIALSGIGIGVFLTIYPLRYKDEIAEAAATYDLPPELIASIIRAESSFRRGAIGPKGEIGLMQLMPSTAAWLAVKMESPGLEKKLDNPRINITFGAFYMRMMLDRFGDLRTALIAYNAGPTKADRWLDDPNYACDENKVLLRTPYPSTNAYVAKIMNAKRHYRWRF